MKVVGSVVCFLILFGISHVSGQIYTCTGGDFIFVKAPSTYMYSEANSWCLSTFGTTLASVKSTSEFDYIQTLSDNCGGTTYAWLGGQHDQSICEATSRTQWVWEDGSSWDSWESSSSFWASSACSVGSQPNSCSADCIYISYECWMAADTSCTFTGVSNWVCNRPPTPAPTKAPTKKPTQSPSPKPTKMPTAKPTDSPTTSAPSFGPTRSPSENPSSMPTKMPSSSPTFPSNAPTKGPFRVLHSDDDDDDDDDGDDGAENGDSGDGTDDDGENPDDSGTDDGNGDGSANPETTPAEDGLGTGDDSSTSNGGGSSLMALIWIVIIAIVAVLLCTIVILAVCLRRQKKKLKKASLKRVQSHGSELPRMGTRSEFDFDAQMGRGWPTTGKYGETASRQHIPSASPISINAYDTQGGGEGPAVNNAYPVTHANLARREMARMTPVNNANSQFGYIPDSTGTPTTTTNTMGTNILPDASTVLSGHLPSGTGLPLIMTGGLPNIPDDTNSVATGISMMGKGADPTPNIQGNESSSDEELFAVAETDKGDEYDTPGNDKSIAMLAFPAKNHREAATQGQRRLPPPPPPSAVGSFTPQTDGYAE